MMNSNSRLEYAQRLRQLARATYDAAGVPRGLPRTNNSDPRMQLTQDAVDRILQDSREEGFCFLDRQALDEWLRDHDVEAVCGNGRTLLLWAAARRRYDAIRELLARGADPNARDMKEGCCGRTALFWAVETMHFDTVRLLVRHGARVDDFDLGGLDFGLNQPPQTALQNLMFTRYRRIRRDEYSDDYELEVPEHHWRELECMVKLLLSLGATNRHVRFPLELSHWSMARCSVPPEQLVQQYPWSSTEIVGLLRAVREAGGWKKYVGAPRRAMVMLRAKCARGRAAAKAGTVLARLFPSKASALTLPNELFWRVFQFWRCAGVDVPVTTFRSEHAGPEAEAERRAIERRDRPCDDRNSEYWADFDPRPSQLDIDNYRQDDFNEVRPRWWYEIDDFDGKSDPHIF